MPQPTSFLGDVSSKHHLLTTWKSHLLPWGKRKYNIVYTFIWLFVVSLSLHLCLIYCLYCLFLVIKNISLPFLTVVKVVVITCSVFISVHTRTPPTYTHSSCNSLFNVSGRVVWATTLSQHACFDGFYPHFRVTLPVFTTSLSNSSLPNETWYCYCQLRNVFHPVSGRVCSHHSWKARLRLPALFAHSVFMNEW